jgi:zinc protease
MNAKHLARRPLPAAALAARARTCAVQAAVLLLVAALGLAVVAPGAALATGPERPEKINYPALQYTPPDATQYRVKLGNGVAAYLVPDHTLPLVNVTVLMRIGPDLDPQGKEGLAGSTMYLLTRSGTKKMTAEQLEERVAFLGAQLESGMGGGGGMMGFGGVPISGAESRVTLNLLSKDIDEGLGLLTDCLKECAFQDDRLALRKDQQLAQMKKRNDESGTIEDINWGFLMRGEDHWSNHYATEASMKSITKEDLVAFQHKWMGPKNFIIAASGDFDKNDMKNKLEKAFAAWPTPGENPGPPASPKSPAGQGWFITDKDVNQTRVSFGVRSLDRFDPDYYAAQVMNSILGGGGFTSRLVNRIRSDEGLAYSVRSSFEGGYYYPDPWRTVFQTKARSTAYAMQVALTEVNRMRDSLVTPDELTTAKASFVEGFPSRFPNAQAIAGGLAAEELTGRFAKDPKFFREFTSRFDKIGAPDVQRVARRLLDPQKMAYLMVGNAKDMMQDDGKHPVTLEKLAGGTPKRLPLRDPLTMKPLQ